MIRTRLISFLLIGVWACASLNAQEDVSIDYKDFRDVVDASKKDVKALKEADDVYFSEGDTYTEALPLFLQLYSIAPEYDPLNWRIAMCYLRSDAKNESLPYIKACDSSVSPLFYYMLGKSYQFAGEYEQAKVAYETFDSTFTEEQYKTFYKTFEVKEKNYPFERVMSDLIRACEIGMEKKWEDKLVEFNNLAILNKETEEIAPVLLPDNKLLYASNRKNGNYTTYQIYEVKFDSSEIIGVPRISSLFPEEEEDSRIPLPYYELNEGLLFQSMAEGGDVFLSAKKGRKYKAQAFPKVNSSTLEGSACRLDEESIVFSRRDKKTNHSDLFISQKNDKGKWSKPLVLGDSINSSGREEVVSFSEGELYFISNGPGTIGGFDIFKVPYWGDNTWGEVENLGAPINTAENDMAFIPIDSTKALYAGVRPEGEGGSDIYMVTISDIIPVDSLKDTIVIDSVALFAVVDSAMLEVDSLWTDSLLMGEFADYNAKMDSALLLDSDFDPDSIINNIQELADSVRHQIDEVNDSLKVYMDN